MLARSPGIAISRNGGPTGSSSVYIRGGEQRHTALLVDGVRLDSQATGGASWNTIPLGQIDRIEILRGPCAAIYGSDALAGVIQVFTRRGEAGLHPSIEFGIGSYGTRKVDLAVSGAEGNFDYALGLAYERSNGFNVQPASINTDRDGYRMHSTAVRLGYTLNPQHRIELNMLDSRINAQYDNGFTPLVDDHALNHTQTLGMSWNAQWSDAYTSRISISQGKDNYETKPSIYATDTTVTSYLWHNEYRQGGHLLSADVERREDKLNNAGTLPSTQTQRSQNALALGYGYQMGAHNVQLNLRRDDDSEFGNKNTSNIGYAFAFMPHWKLTAATGSAFRAPTLYQRFSEYGKAGLRPETGRNSEFGFKYLQSGDEFSASIYHNRVTDLIAYIGGPGTCASPWGCYDNVDKATYKGINLAAATTLQDVRLSASLDLQNPKDNSTNKLLPRRAKTQATLTADRRVGTWDLGGELQYVGKRFDRANEVAPLKKFSVLNLSASSPIAKDWRVVGRVDNLGNANNETAKGFATGGRQLYIGLKWQPQ